MITIIIIHTHIHLFLCTHTHTHTQVLVSQDIGLALLRQAKSKFDAGDSNSARYLCFRAISSLVFQVVRVYIYICVL